MQDLLNLYAPISLEDMREIRLMNRIDTKFVTTVPVLLQLLEMAKDDYWAQEIDGERNLAYQTTYFDTLDYNHGGEDKEQSWTDEKETHESG